MRPILQPRLISSCSIVLATLALCGCASIGKLATPSGRPEVTIPRAYAKNASVAITSLNLSRGRELDVAKSDRLITYDGLKDSQGNLKVSSKFVYSFVPKNDSVTILSRKLATEDLDDDESDATELADQPSLDAQQHELQEIVTVIMNEPSDDADPNATVSTHEKNTGAEEHSQ